jgi:hypothetical protein
MIPAASIPKDAYQARMDEWALAIGRFLLAFTACEGWTYLFVKTFGSEALREAVADQLLKPRIAVARAVLIDYGINEAMQARVDAAFSKIEKLSGPRNIVAHNGLMFNVYEDGQGRVDIRHELVSQRDPTKDITVERLRQLTVEAQQLDEEFTLLYGLIRKPEHRYPDAAPR